MSKLLSAAVLALLAGTFVAAPTHAADPAPAQPTAAASTAGSRVVADRAPSIVTVKFMLKMDENEREVETSGVMMDGSGLVLCSNMPFGGMMAFAGMSVPTPTEIKVLVGDDTEGVAAKFLARDSELGLAWIQVNEAPKSPYAFVDFAQSAEPATGDQVYTVSLMGKFFDRAPQLSEGFVSAVVRKPRHLFMPSLGLALVTREDGLPIFDASNKVVGFSTLILPEREEMQGNQMEAAMKGFLGMMILPAKDVVDATARAKETAKNAPAATEGETPKPDAPAEAPKADAPAAPVAPK